MSFEPESLEFTNDNVKVLGDLRLAIVEKVAGDKSELRKARRGGNLICGMCGG